jgi:Xaa-Pro aminopeptidase
MSQELFPKFSKEEMQRRHTAVRAAMERYDFDCLIVAGSSARWNEKYANIRYLTEFVDKETSSSYLVFPLEADPTLLIWSSVRLHNARLMSCVQDIRPVHPYYVDAIVERLRELKLQKGRIGIQGYDTYMQIPHDHFEELRKELPDANLQFVNIVERMRLIKSDEEVGFMKKAAELSDLAVRNMVQTTRPGMRDSQVYANIDHSIAMNGGEAPFLTLVGSTSMANPSLAFPNITPSARAIESGDLILTEITAKYAGYWGQTHKPVALGQPPSNIMRMFKVAKRVYDVLAEQLFPGNSFQAVLKAGQKVLDEERLAKIAPFTHGIGMEAPEEPVIGLDKWPLEPVEIREGMCFSVEPNPVTQDRKIGGFLGDTFLVTKKGSVCLNQYPAELTVL